MEWALAILFATATLLLSLSYYKNWKFTKAQKQKDETTFYSMREELNEIQNQIRNLELDSEITALEAGLQSIHSSDRQKLRAVIDLYKRGYSLDNISKQVNVNKKEISNMLAPYMTIKVERNVANDR